MSGGLFEGFFYGLYMDSDLLVKSGYNPTHPQLACLDGFRIDLRGPIKLIPDSGKSAWGMVFTLPEADLHAMYSGPNTRDYQPCTMMAKTPDGSVVRVRCYNRDPIAGAEFNREYLDKLIVVARKANLPEEYIRELEIME